MVCSAVSVIDNTHWSTCILVWSSFLFYENSITTYNRLLISSKKLVSLTDLHLSHIIDRKSQSTYWNVVTVRPVAITSIRKLSVVCDFGLGFHIFICSVTHGPSSIVWRHVTVGQECIWMVSSIRVQPVHAILLIMTSFSDILAVYVCIWLYWKNITRLEGDNFTHLGCLRTGQVTHWTNVKPGARKALCTWETWLAQEHNARSLRSTRTRTSGSENQRTHH